MVLVKLNCLYEHQKMTTRLKLTHGFSSQNPIYPPITKNVFVSEGEDFAKSLGCSDCFWLRTTLKINTIRNRMPIKEILFCLIIQGSKLTVIGENIYLNPLELSPPCTSKISPPKVRFKYCLQFLRSTVKSEERSIQFAIESGAIKCHRRMNHW